MLLMLLEAHAGTPSDTSSLRTVAAGGSTISPDLARRVQQTTGARMTVIYGLTEVCSIALATGHHDDDDVRTTSAEPPSPTPQ